MLSYEKRGDFSSFSEPAKDFVSNVPNRLNLSTTKHTWHIECKRFRFTKPKIVLYLNVNSLKFVDKFIFSECTWTENSKDHENLHY